LAETTNRGVVAADKPDDELPETDIHDVLRNDRRRMVIELLGDSEEPVTARELSEAIAARETGEEPPPRDVRQSVYISLQQTHLPKLADLGIVEYDEQTKEVRPAGNAPAVGVYMEVVPKYGLSYAEYYAALGVLGALLVTAAEVGVPGVSAVSASVWAVAVFGVLVASAAYQTYSQRSTLVHRLRD
jgi:DNA-binding transcriptional ArsR family regulator